MLDLSTRIALLKRPEILARAARFGLDDYRRDIHLKRLLCCDTLPKHGPAIIQLLEREDAINALRIEGSATYRAATHVSLLIAILGEASLLRQSRETA